MKLYTVEEIAPELAELFNVTMSEEHLAAYRGRQYVCTPREYIANQMNGVWTPDILTANRYLNDKTFVFNTDRSIEEVTKRFILYRGEVKTVPLEEGGIKLSGMTALMEFNDMDELKKILEDHPNLILIGVGHVLFDLQNLNLGGYPVVNEETLLATGHRLLG